MRSGRCDIRLSRGTLCKDLPLASRLSKVLKESLVSLESRLSSRRLEVDLLVLI